MCSPFSLDVLESTTTKAAATTTTPVSNTVSKSSQFGARAVAACKKYIDDMPAPLDTNILGGIEAARGEFPHMAAFGYEDEAKNRTWACAGSLISDRYILTAAHCLSNDSNLPTVIRLGQNILESTEQYVDYVVEVRI